MKPGYTDEVRRAALPEIMFSDDVAMALRVTCEEGADLLAGDQCGRAFMVFDRIAVLRTAFLDAIEVNGVSL